MAGPVSAPAGEAPATPDRKDKGVGKGKGATATSSSGLLPDPREDETSEDTETETSEDTETETSEATARQYITGLIGMREFLNYYLQIKLGYREMLERQSFQIYGGILCLEIDVEGLLHDGLASPCYHQGVGHAMVFHGTKDITRLLCTRGVMQDAKRPLVKKTKNGRKVFCTGWYHTVHFSRGLRYAKVHTLKRTRWRPVVRFNCPCRNACGRANRWQYTRSGCTHYAVSSIVMVPADLTDINDFC